MNLGIPAPFSMSRAVGTVAILSVLALTGACMQRAYANIAVPNHTETTLIAPSGGSSPAITIPVNNSPVTVTGTTLTVNQRGTGFMHVTYANTAPAVLSYAGVNSTGNATGGQVPLAGVGDVILLCGTGALATGPALNQLHVENTQAEGFSVQVVVEMIW